KIAQVRPQPRRPTNTAARAFFPNTARRSFLNPRELPDSFFSAQPAFRQSPSTSFPSPLLPRTAAVPSTAHTRSRRGHTHRWPSSLDPSVRLPAPAPGSPAFPTQRLTTSARSPHVPSALPIRNRLTSDSLVRRSKCLTALN